MNVTIHQAGPVVDAVQRCTRCGYVLTDNRNTPRDELLPWPEGRHIEVIFNGTGRTMSTTDDPPDCRREFPL